MSEVTFSDLIGKIMLIGMTYYTHDDQFVEQKQFWGKVAEIREDVILVQQKNGENISLPPDLRSVKIAPPDTYRLRSTGETIENPDFLSTWIVHGSEPNQIFQEGEDTAK